MAVTNQKTTELGDEYRGKPINDHGKLRVQYFDLPATTVAGDATSTVDLCNLPHGQIRVIPSLSRLNHSAFGASRTLDIGHRAYQKRGDPAETVEAEDEDALADGLDVSALGAGVAFGTDTGYDMFSHGGIGIFATVKGGTIPVGATLSGVIVYVHE